MCWQELLRLSSVAAARVAELHPQTQSEQAITAHLIQHYVHIQTSMTLCNNNENNSIENNNVVIRFQSGD